MATVKKGNVPPTHPSVWLGLGLAVVGLILAIYSYTGARVYDIAYALVALAGGLVALAGIMTAAWGRSIMAARTSRSRRAAMSRDALAIGRAEPREEKARAPAAGSEELPTIAAPRSKRGFSFPLPKRAKKEEKPADPAALFAFKRREPAPAAPPGDDAPLVRLVEDPKPVRATLKCPLCAEQFSAEGVRPFEARCPACGFSSSV